MIQEKQWMNLDIWLVFYETDNFHCLYSILQNCSEYL